MTAIYIYLYINAIIAGYTLCKNVEIKSTATHTIDNFIYMILAGVPVMLYLLVKKTIYVIQNLKEVLKQIEDEENQEQQNIQK